MNCPDCGAPAGYGCTRVQLGGSVYYRLYALCLARVAKASRLSNGGRAPLHVVGGEVLGEQLDLGV